jgi:hypothetical protein
VQIQCSLTSSFASSPSPLYRSQIPEAITNFISGPLKAILATFHRTFLKYTDPEATQVSAHTSKPSQVDLIISLQFLSLFFSF